MFNYVWWRYDKALSADDCTSIIESTPWDTPQDAKVYINDELRNETHIRRTTIDWLAYDSDLGAFLLELAQHANDNAGWNFAVDWQESVQIAKYSDQGDHYDWHIDTVKPDEHGRQRKLSVVLLLSPRDSYTGGELEIRSGVGQSASIESPIREQGDVIVFPSILEHRVTAVTQGIRYSAVNWIGGPAFR